MLPHELAEHLMGSAPEHSDRELDLLLAIIAREIATRDHCTALYLERARAAFSARPIVPRPVNVISLPAPPCAP